MSTESTTEEMTTEIAIIDESTIKLVAVSKR